jgi:hypothetical protein
MNPDPVPCHWRTGGPIKLPNDIDFEAPSHQPELDMQRWLPGGWCRDATLGAGRGSGRDICERGVTVPHRAYSTSSGTAYWGRVENFVESAVGRRLAGSVQLILTSPPFPLNRKKAYGNLAGEEYKSWVACVMRRLSTLLTRDGSLVIELGNSWVSRSPEMSTLPLETLLAVKRAADLSLCQQFIVHNPARLPSPVQWVNVERTRVKDTFTNVWWLSPTPRPLADNRRVLNEYSTSMKKLLERGSYNSGRRPSGHEIGDSSFLQDHGGSIPANVIEASNTTAAGAYPNWCREISVPIHPARMQPEVTAFFINFLTEEGHLVLDPFAGSNTTGASAERLGRRWVALDADLDYLRGSVGRFDAARWWLGSQPLRANAPS